MVQGVMDIGLAIKKCRQARQMTLGDLAKATGFSPSYLSLIEKGSRTPNLEIIEKIAAALEVPLSILVFLGSDRKKIAEFSPELAEKMSQLSFDLIMGNKNDDSRYSL